MQQLDSGNVADGREALASHHSDTFSAGVSGFHSSCGMLSMLLTHRLLKHHHIRVTASTPAAFDMQFPAPYPTRLTRARTFTRARTHTQVLQVNRHILSVRTGALAVSVANGCSEVDTVVDGLVILTRRARHPACKYARMHIPHIRNTRARHGPVQGRYAMLAWRYITRQVPT